MRTVWCRLLSTYHVSYTLGHLNDCKLSEKNPVQTTHTSSTTSTKDHTSYQREEVVQMEHPCPLLVTVVSGKLHISHCGVTRTQKNALTEIGEMKRPLCEYVSQHRRANSSCQDIAVYLHLRDNTHSFKDNKNWIHRRSSVPKRSIRGHLCKTGTHRAWTKGKQLIRHLLSTYNGTLQLSPPVYTSRPRMSCGLTKCHDISGVMSWWNFPAFRMTDEAQMSEERTLRLYSMRPDTVNYYSHCFSTLRAQERWACGKNTTFCHSTLCLSLSLSVCVYPPLHPWL